MTKIGEPQWTLGYAGLGDKLVDQTKCAEFEATVRKHLDAEYARNKEIADQVKALEGICVMAIAACADHSPLLGRMLQAKAEAVFGRELK